MPARVARWASCAAVILSVWSARADESELIRVVVHAPASCVDEVGFAGEITGRTPRAVIVRSGEARTFTVTLTKGAGKVRGVLTISSGAGSPAVREVSGAACEEVVSALGLVAALAIDPRASTEVKLAAPARPPPRPPFQLPPMPRPRVFDRLPWWGPIGPPLPVIPGPSVEPRWRAGWGLGVSGVSAVAPSLSLSLAGFVDIERVGGGLLSPSLRAAFFDVDSGIRAASSGHSARFALLGGRVEGCPIRLPIASWLGAYPCVRFEAGALTSTGFAHVSLTSTRPWAAPGTTARLGAEIAGRFRVEAEAGVNFPLVRDTFSFAPPGGSQTVQTVPSAGGTIGVAVGTHFP